MLSKKESTNDKFRSGNITTAFLDQEYPKGYDGSSKDTERQYLIALNKYYFKPENNYYSRCL